MGCIGCTFLLVLLSVLGGNYTAITIDGRLYFCCDNVTTTTMMMMLFVCMDEWMVETAARWRERKKESE
jgi:ABC-type uncharacterized transport system permease subunit